MALDDLHKQSQLHLSLINKNLTDSSPDILNIPLDYPNIIKFSLCNNQLTEYPQCLLQCKQIVSLDIRKNPFKDYSKLIKALSSYPSLAELHLDFNDSSQVQSLLNSIPQLILINGKSTKDFISLIDIDEKDIEGVSLDRALPNLNMIFKHLQSSLQNRTKDKDKEHQGRVIELFNEFQSAINEEANRGNSGNNNDDEEDDNSPNYSIANTALRSQCNILRFFSNKLLQYYSNIPNDKDKELITKEIFDEQYKVIDALMDIITKVTSKIENKEAIRRSQLELILQSMNDTTTPVSLVSCGSLLQLHNNTTKDFYLTKIERLETENKYMIDKLIQMSKQITSNQSHSYVIDNKQQSIIASSPYNDQSNIGFTTTNNNTMSYINNSISSVSSLSQSGSITGSIASPNKVSIGITGAKIISISLMKEFITEIYTSKIDSDRRSKENHLPRETMEQHMYSHLHTKYGLRNLVIEWASSIINCIKLYSKDDCDICLLGKIIRNEIEEDSRLVMDKVKLTINDLIEYSLKAKTPFISKVDLNKAMQGKIEGIMPQEEWKKILYSVHSKEDAEVIEKELEEMSCTDRDNRDYRSNREAKASNRKMIMTREQVMNMSYSKMTEGNSISYKTFIQCVCRYHIRYRVKYLKPFVRLFRKCDEDRDGIVNEEEFKTLIHMAYPINETGIKTKVKGKGMDKDMSLDIITTKLLNVIDPYNNNKITFTECVALFSIEYIGDNEEGISLLDNICLHSTDSIGSSDSNTNKNA